jgi:hypothetical protein
VDLFSHVCCVLLMIVVDTISSRLREMRRRKRDLKEQLRKLTVEMESLKIRQGAMVAREVEALDELDQAEALANAAPAMIAVSDDLVFDFLEMDRSGFEDGTWDELLRNAQSSNTPEAVRCNL